MKYTPKNRRNPAGYVSYLTVLGMGVILLTMMVASYKRSIQAQDTQQKTGLRIDYSEKEEAILRAIVSLTPNRAIGAMQAGSNSSSSSRARHTWRQIFSDALDQANARQSVSTGLVGTFGLEDHQIANSGDSGFADVSRVFDAIEPEAGFVAPGIGRSLGAGFPPPLESSVSQVVSRDRIYPIISRDKRYGTLSSGMVGLPPNQYPNFNLIEYPEIRFGYAEPGEPFVAKRNWWAFSLDLADADDHLTGLNTHERDFIISIYEIPSQLAISAEAFTVLGKHGDGSDWANATVAGGVFATRARVEDNLNLARISGRRGLNISSAATIAHSEMAPDPFAPGIREKFELENQAFLPVSLASESGRAGFIPINRGAEFFDRHAHPAESSTLSSTTWRDYSIGAQQCAMWLDIVEVVSDTNPTPSKLRFQYLKGGNRTSLDVHPLENPVSGLPPGYIWCCKEDQSMTFNGPVDVAYGANGQFYYQSGVSGTVTFNNARFGDPLVGNLKDGYYRPSYPFEVTLLHGLKQTITVYPQRFPAFLAMLGADGPAVNHSLTVNVDYVANPSLTKPLIPCTDDDYAVVLEECGDLTAFSRGFSLVTNLRLYFGDDFNIVETTPPTGSGLPTPYYPPASLFAPEKRYGAAMDPLRLKIGGQMGSLAGGDASDAAEIHLLDMKGGSESMMAHDHVEVNLSPIKHPAALPPVTMMNWLIVVEERRAAFYGGM